MHDRHLLCAILASEPSETHSKSQVRRLLHWPGLQVTIAPREKYPLGQTVLKVNEQRERTHMFTRRYLEEQLYTVLAGVCACGPCIWRQVCERSQHVVHCATECAWHGAHSSRWHNGSSHHRCMEPLPGRMTD